MKGAGAYVIAALVLAFIAYYFRPIYAVVALVILILLMRAL